jgi:anti-anti-sigma factor
MLGMEISQREVRGVTILDLAGRLVAEEGVEQFVEHMNTLRHQGHKRILLNFDRVTYLDSAGVGAVAWKYVTARKHDGDVKLLNLRPKSHTVLKATKLLTVIENFESEDQAIDSFVDHHQQEDDDTDPIFT